MKFDLFFNFALLIFGVIYFFVDDVFPDKSISCYGIPSGYEVHRDPVNLCQADKCFNTWLMASSFISCIGLLSNPYRITDFLLGISSVQP